MSQFTTPPHDQAQVLRKLARPVSGGGASEAIQSIGLSADGPRAVPGKPVDAQAVAESNLPARSPHESRSQHKIENAPHVVLVSETHSLQGGLALALHLARQISDSGQRALLVDLAPAASRLGDAIAANSQRFPDWTDQVQPLWTPAPHGRTLHTWNTSRLPLDIVAQLTTEFPTAEQMPRICEQLVRQLGQQRSQESDGLPKHYRTVFLLSEFVGVPLDSAAWQAADEIWLLHDIGMKAEPIRAGLAARLSPRSRGQRMVLLAKQPPKLRNWASRRRVERLGQPLGGYAEPGHNVEHYQLAWPQVPNRLARSMAGTAREVAAQLLAGARPHSTRQAS